MNKLRKILDKVKLKTEIHKGNSSLSSSSQDTILGNSVQDTISIAKEQEAPIFTRKNVLVEEFSGEPPIVYASHFGIVLVGKDKDESDEKAAPPVIRKQDQYGYVGDDATKTEEDEWMPSKEGEIPGDKAIKLVVPKSNTASIVSPKAEFDERWERIKKAALDTNENAIIIE